MAKAKNNPTPPREKDDPTDAHAKDGEALEPKDPAPIYRVAAAHTLLSLQHEVNTLIGEGYTPIGGIGIKSAGPIFGEQFAQAMVLQ